MVNDKGSLDILFSTFCSGVVAPMPPIREMPHSLSEVCCFRPPLWVTIMSETKNCDFDQRPVPAVPQLTFPPVAAVVARPYLDMTDR